MIKAKTEPVFRIRPVIIFQIPAVKGQDRAGQKFDRGKNESNKFHFRLMPWHRTISSKIEYKNNFIRLFLLCLNFYNFHLVFKCMYLRVMNFEYWVYWPFREKLRSKNDGFDFYSVRVHLVCCSRPRIKPDIMPDLRRNNWPCWWFSWRQPRLL